MSAVHEYIDDGAEESVSTPEFGSNWVVLAGTLLSIALIMGFGLLGLPAGVQLLLIALASVAACLWLIRSNRPGTTIVVIDQDASPLLSSLIDGAGRNTASAGRGDIRRVTSWDEAVALAATSRCDRILLANEHMDRGDVKDLGGRPVQVGPHLFIVEELLGRTPLETDADAGTRQAVGFQVPWVTSGTKRALDVFGAFVLLVVLSPVMFLVALVLSVTGRRPVTISVPHRGAGGRPVHLCFFNIDRGPNGAPRASAGGAERLLRSIHVDLLPLLFNVLRGDLSLVGPRPEMVESGEVSSLVAVRNAVRSHARPGLASLAQVRFRYTDAPRDQRLALEYDLYYVRHASMAVDVRVFGRAVLVVLSDIGHMVATGTRHGADHVAHTLALPARLVNESVDRRPITIAMPRLAGATHGRRAVVHPDQAGLRLLPQELWAAVCIRQV